MITSKTISLFGAGLLVLSAGTLVAQEAGTRSPGREGAARENAAPGNTAPEPRAGAGADQVDRGARAGQDTRRV